MKSQLTIDLPRSGEKSLLEMRRILRRPRALIGVFGLVAAAAVLTGCLNTTPSPTLKGQGTAAVVSASSVQSVLAWNSAMQQTTVSNGAPGAQFVFTLTNVSTVPITIRRVQTSCECTEAKLRPLPWTLAPGDHGRIQVTMELMGNVTTMIRWLRVETDRGNKLLSVRTDVLPASGGSGMSAVVRAENQRIAMANRQAVFGGDCARCHAEPGRGKKGEALYAAVCGICHDSPRRAAGVPDLHQRRAPANAAYWRNWTAYGKPGTWMPAFAKSEGGMLTEAQIASLADYLDSAEFRRAAAR